MQTNGYTNQSENKINEMTELSNREKDLINYVSRLAPSLIGNFVAAGLGLFIHFALP